MPVTIMRDLLEIDDEKNHEKTLAKTHLRFKGRLRWNILMNIIVLVIMSIPFYAPLLVTFILNAYFLFIGIVFTLAATIKHFRINASMNRYKKFAAMSNTLRNRNDSKLDCVIESKYKFIMATFAYKEPLPLLIKNLKNISSLHGSEEVIVVISLEERTPDLEYKIATLSQMFETKFKEIVITVHPFGVEGEIPGKCSNSNYGMRMLCKHLQDISMGEFKPEEYIITNYDIDTVFDKNYLNILKYTVNKTKHIDRVVWQPLLYYNWDFNRLSFFTRIVGIMRSTMMAGATTTFNINIMSVYSASLKLYIDGNFVHPFYQMDDIICYIRWLIVSKNYIKIKSIYSATLSGPTSGSNMLSELAELIRQSQRWAIGSAEVFHYFVIKIRRINLILSIIWSFNYLNYYCGFLCAQGFLSITTVIRLFLFTNEEFIKDYFWILLCISYGLMLWMILLNKLAVYTFLKDLNVKEHIDSTRELAHFILSVPTQIFYSWIVMYGFFALIFAGKTVCKHGASKKDALKF